MSELLRIIPMTGFKDVKRLNKYNLTAEYSHATKEEHPWGIDVAAELERIIPKEFEPLSINDFNSIYKMGLTKFVSYDEYMKKLKHEYI